jgi:hypothetical protein
MAASPDDANGRWIQRGDDMSWREIDGEVIVLDLRAATYLRLNPSGALLWRELESGAAKDELVHLLADRFQLDAALAGSDVAAFLESCLANDLIKPQQP